MSVNEAQVNEVLPGLIPAIREQVLADAKARIEDLHYGDDNLLIGTGYQLAVNDALAALTQPQTEIEGKPDGTWYDIPDGGGAATAAGVADADLEGEGVYEAVYACLDACGGTMGSTALHFLADLDERGFRVVRATHESFTEEPGPYAKAFRERVCPVPEFPGIKNRQEDQA